jgi:DNA-binding MarR family transcriptional regulator
MAATQDESSEPVVPLRVGAGFEDEFPGASPTATECAMNLVRAASLFLSEADRYRRTVTDLSAAACQVLAIIEGAGEPLPPHVIVARLLVTSGTMTAVLDTLERRGYIVRIPHPNDRRGLLIDITDSARAVVDALLPRIHAAERNVFASLAEHECTTFIELLGRVQAHLQSLKDTPAVDGAPRVRPKRA